MSTIPASVFADALQTLGRDEFVAFVADIWEQSGWTVQTETRIVTVEKGKRREQLLVLPALFLARFRSVPSTEDVDRIVTSLRVTDRSDLPRGTPDVPVVDADDLRHRLLYGLDTDGAEQLCADYLGVSVRSSEWDADSTSVRSQLVSRLPDRQSEGPAPVSRRTTLSLLGFGAVGGIVYGARSLLRDDGTTQSSFDDDPPPTPEDVGAPDVQFEFEFENGAVTIIHAGGDTAIAGNLYVRGDGLVDGTERQWSDAQEYTVESEIEAGDTLQIPVEGSGSIDVTWDDGTKEETLATFSGAEIEGANVVGSRITPEVNFEYSYSNGVLTITHDSGDTFRAGRVLIKGTGFEKEPRMLWSDTPAAFETTKVAAGSSITLSADETIVVQLYWDHEERSELISLDQYTGPGRPLDPDISGPSTFSMDSSNTGVAPSVTGPSSPATERFTFETSRPIGSSPAVVDGKLYVANLAGNVFCLDAADGTEIWRFQTADVIWSGSPTVVQDVVYIGSTDGNLYALGADTGDVRWEFPRLRRVLSSPTYSILDGKPLLFVSGEGPGPSGMLFAIDAVTGNERWRFEVGGEPSSAPAVVDGTVYVGGNEGTAYAIDARDGTELWRFQEPSERNQTTNGVHVMDSAAAVVDDTVFIGSTSGWQYALATDTGSERWNRELDGGISSSPAVVERVVAEEPLGPTAYVGSVDENLYALDATDGSERWVFETDGPVISSPSAVGTAVSADAATVYVGSFDSALYALDAVEGTERWSYETDGQVLSSPAIADGTVYFGSGDGTLYAVESEQ